MILSLVFLFILYCLRNSILDLLKYEFKFLEFIWTLIPCFFLIFLGIPSLKLLYFSENILKNPRISINITAHQWYWSYDYSDFKNLEFDSYILPKIELIQGIYRLLEVDNRVVLPFNSLIRFIVTSRDVLHSWALPSLGIKVDANPGRLNQICSLRLSSSINYGQCSEICGANHSFIPILVEFTSPLAFKSWINSIY